MKKLTISEPQCAAESPAAALDIVAVDVPFDSDSGSPPSRQHDDDAGFDLVSEADAILRPGERRLIPTGLRLAIPPGHVGMVCSRSGLAARDGVFVLNAPGIIDPGYRGEIAVLLANLSDQRFVISAGDRIAQLVIVPTAAVAFVSEPLSDSDRGDGGFGSTGV